MTELIRSLSEEEYNELRHQETQRLAGYLLTDNNDGIDAFLINDYVANCLDLDDERWIDCSFWSIARYSDNKLFNPYEDVELNAPAENIIRAIAFNTLFTDLKKHLEQKIEELHQAEAIHTYLEQLYKGDYDEPISPTTLVNEFNRWLVTELDTQEGGEPLEYDDFNETHVRRINAIDVWNQELLDYLWEWLLEKHDEFPDCVFNT